MDHTYLIRNLAAKNHLSDPLVENAFRVVKREDFVTDSYIVDAYEDKDLPIKGGQMINSPSIVAFMLGLLKPQVGDNVLDLGSGSGYTTCLLANIVGHKGYVCGVEVLPELIGFGTDNLRKYSLVNSVIVPAESKIGNEKFAPYDKILVSFFVKQIPQELINQLKPEGVMVIPVLNDILKVTKPSDSSKELSIDTYTGYNFQKAIGDY